MMRKSLAVLLCVLLAGCARTRTAAPKGHEEELKEDIVTEARTASITPNKVSDYDREAVTSLINLDLTKIYGKKGYRKLDSSDIMMKKSNGEISAIGTYYYGYGNTSESFKYVFKDENVTYTLVSKENGIQEDESGYSSGKVDKKPATNTPVRSYSVSVSKGISVSIKHMDSGSILVRIVNEQGSVVKDILNTAGPIDTTIETALSSGNYSLELYTDDWYSIRYACY